MNDQRFFDLVIRNHAGPAILNRGALVIGGSQDDAEIEALKLLAVQLNRAIADREFAKRANDAA